MGSELVYWRFPLYFYFSFLCSSSCFPCAHALGSVLGGNDTDRLALLAFKAEITSDPFGTLSSWNDSTHFCRWIGVTCGRRHQRVTMLELDSQELVGPISPHVGNLSFLRKLWLRHNRLSHTIPQELGRLRRLQSLSVINNSLIGEIPVNISAAKSLTVVEFSLNLLVGGIPTELGALSKLKGLYIKRNNLTRPIPFVLGNLTSLEVIYAPENRISGNIPEELGRLKILITLSLSNNQLVGTIPSSIFNISSIQGFDVSKNKIGGNLPSNFGLHFSNLSDLRLTFNLFNGSIPFSIANASKLERLGLGANQFTGNVPPLESWRDLQAFSVTRNFLGTGKPNDLNFLSSLTNATSLYLMGFRDNNFGGVLPDLISNFSNLQHFYFDSNKIGGKIPTGIENLVNLGRLQMSNNRLTGEIPSGIGKLQNLQFLSLSNNEFFRNIPRSLGNLSLLVELRLNVNNFHGQIPLELGNCKVLQVLSLGENNLTGTIPSEVLGVSSLLNLTVHQNHFTGPLPVKIENLINLEVLDVSQNMFSSEIPSTISSCVTLRLLYAPGNNLQGKLPSSLSYLRGIEELDLSCNNFSGEIPLFLGDYDFLRKLNLSFNDFEGMVPEMGIFKNATSFFFFFEGNKKLCGGIPKFHLRDCNSEGSKSKRSTVISKLVIPTTCGLVGLLLVLMFLYHSWIRKRTKVPSFRNLGDTFKKVSYQDLLKATGGFSQSNLIGQGDFGLVYKGILDEPSGKIVAVKVLNLEFRRACKSFIAECKALKNIKHRNLVKVVTACSSIDYQCKDFKALVYEFMANGSLEEWLHQNYENKDDDDDANEPTLMRKLNLLQRLNIAIDVASAVNYLHNHCAESIVHCDLKSSNVLLDNEMVGHVGDFGLARFFPKSAASNSSAYQSSSLGIRGSIGYVPPEYGMGNEVSRAGDVYSFGILLMETFTGKRPTDKLFSGSFSLRDFVKMTLSVPEQVAGIVDLTLSQTVEEIAMAESTSTSVPITVTLADHNFNSADSHRILECLISIFNVGIACSEEQPRDRMGIHDVVSQLHVIRSNYIGSSSNGVLIHRARRVNQFI